VRARSRSSPRSRAALSPAISSVSRMTSLAPTSAYCPRRPGGDRRPPQRAPAGRATIALARDDLAELVRSVHRAAADHAVRHALRDPRRARAPYPGYKMDRVWREPGRRARTARPTSSSYGPG
jgi:hypothetical protein